MLKSATIGLRQNQIFFPGTATETPPFTLKPPANPTLVFFILICPHFPKKILWLQNFRCTLWNWPCTTLFNQFLKQFILGTLRPDFDPSPETLPRPWGCPRQGCRTSKRPFLKLRVPNFTRAPEANYDHWGIIFTPLASQQGHIYKSGHCVPILTQASKLCPDHGVVLGKAVGPQIYLS